MANNKTNIIIRNTLNIVLLIPFIMILATVFVVNAELANPTVSGKYFWFYGWMGVATVIIVIIYHKNRNNISWGLADLLVLLFGVVALVSSYCAGKVINTKWILLLLCLVLYFYFRVVLSGNGIHRYLLVLFLICTALIEAVWGLRQLYGFSGSQHFLFKLTGSFFNPGPFAGYLAVVAPLAFYFVWTDYRAFKLNFSWRLFWFYVRWGVSALTLIGVLLVLPAAMSRASWLAALFGCAVVVLSQLMKNRKWQHYIKHYKKKIVLVLLLLLVGIALAGAGMYYLKKDSADGRALMWKISLRIIPKHPWGVGLNNFSGTYGVEQADYFASGEGTEQEQFVAGSPEYAFNEYLQMCIELGFIPFLLFIGIIGVVFIQHIRQKFPGDSSGVTGALVALLVFAFMSYPFNLLPFVIVMVFLLGYPTKQPPHKGGLKRFRYFFKLPLWACTFFIVFLCLYNRYPTYNAYKEWRTLKMLYNMKHYNESEKYYAELYPYLNDQSVFLFEYGQTLRNVMQYEQSNGILTEGTKLSCDPMFYNLMGQNYQALKEYDQAEESFVKAIHIIPSRHYPYYLLAKLYVEMGDMEKAKATARLLIDKEPKVPSPAVEEMKEEMRKILSL